MTVRVVVADERHAEFFDAHRPTAPLSDRGSLENPTAGLKDRDLETDRAGRRYGGTSGVMHAGQSGGHHHGVDGERSTEQHELTQFAKHVVDRIEASRLKNEFDKLVLIAPPKMMGLLRRSLSPHTQAVVVAEIPKDLLHSDHATILRTVPKETFAAF